MAACAALTNVEYLDTVRDALLAERGRLFEALSSISWLQPYPSEANFILCKVSEVRKSWASCCPACTLALVLLLYSVCVFAECPQHSRLHSPRTPQERDAKLVRDTLASAGIMVRHYAKKELSGYIRVSVGKPEHTDALMVALRSI